MGTATQPRTLTSKEYAAAGLLLTSAVFLVHFLRFHEFGVYEDDFWSVAAEMGQPLKDLWFLTIFHFQHWYTGRPLNHLLPILLGRVGYRLGGLQAIYAIGAAWLSINSFLTYAIARRLFPAIPSLVVGLAYVLFPADTTKVLLIHVAHVQGAMTFMLLGLLLWFREGWWRRIGYLVAGISLLSYESAFLPFLCAPLLLPATKEKRPLRVWLEHIAACTLIIGVDAVIRVHTGDKRAVDTAGNMGEALYRSITSLFIGPAASGASLFRSTFIGYENLDFPVLFLALGLLALITYVAVNLKICTDSSSTSNPGQTRHALLVGGAALITWSASYALTLTNYPPTQQMGRITSTHVAAGWPFALLAGSIAYFILGLRARERRLASVGAGFAFVGLFSYHQYIQAEYVRSWGLEKQFWSQIVELAPDMDGSSVIVTGSPEPHISPVIGSNSWADDEACQRIFGVNAAGKLPHFAHLGILGPAVVFRKSGSQVEWDPEYWGGPFITIDPANLILFKSDRGVLRRVETVDVSTGSLRTTRPIPAHRSRVWPDTVVSRLFQR